MEQEVSLEDATKLVQNGNIVKWSPQEDMIGLRSYRPHEFFNAMLENRFLRGIKFA